MSEELKQIKKIYGEKMMHLCRDLFPTILETPGKLLGVLTKYLAPTRAFAELVKDRWEDEFKAWVYNCVNDTKDKVVETKKNPYELMDEAGYILYECKNEDDIQSFKHYYAKGEELCTFRGGRLNRCIVFFAVKKNVDEIKREDFKNPEREDLYGTSVISIQFTRGSFCTVSIKNRYNHTVENPDSTYSNNLENIIPGLTKSFEEECVIKLKQTQSSDSFLHRIGYVKARNGKYYHANYEEDGLYYFCENNIVIRNDNFGNNNDNTANVFHNEIIDSYAKNKEKYLLADQYMFCLEEKKVDCPYTANDSFLKSIKAVGEIANISVTKSDNNRIITITYKDGKKVYVEVNCYNSIIRYENNYVENIGDNFLVKNSNIKSIVLPEVKTVGYRFMTSGGALENVVLPIAETIDDEFLTYNRTLEELSLPEVKKVGERFLLYNRSLKRVSFPKLEEIGNDFLRENNSLGEISLPEAKVIADGFMRNDGVLWKISLPKVEYIGNDFLSMNNMLNEISLPEVKKVGNGFITYNRFIESVYLPKLKQFGINFLLRSRQIQESVNNQLNKFNINAGPVPEYRRPRT